MLDRMPAARYNHPSRRAVDGITTFVAAWSAPLIYAGLLLSAFSLRIFDIGGNYLLEGAVATAAMLGLLMRDPLFKAGHRALRLIKKPAVVLTIVVVTTLFVVGALAKGNVAYAYADYRSNMLAFFGFGVAYQFRTRDPLPLIRLGIATGLIGIAAWHMQINSDASVSTKFSYPYLGVVSAAVLACQTRRVFYAVVSIGVLVFLAAVSFYRQYWLTAILTSFFVLSYSIRSFKGKARLRMTGALVFGALMATGVIVHEYQKIQGFFLDDQSRYIQSVGKTSALLDTLNSGGRDVQQSDDTRLAYFQFAATQPWKLVLPHGLDYRSALYHIDPYFSNHGYEATTIDSLFFYLAYHYGFIFSIPLLWWLSWSLWVSRRQFGTLPALSLMVVFAVVLLFDGGNAVVPFKAFWLGGFLALFARPVTIHYR